MADAQITALQERITKEEQRRKQADEGLGVQINAEEGKRFAGDGVLTERVAALEVKTAALEAKVSNLEAKPAPEPEPTPEPTPEPEPTPPPTEGKVLFVDHFTSVPKPHSSAGGWYGQYNAERTFSSSEGTRFEIHQGDVESDTKLELCEVSGYGAKAGDNFYVANRFIWPSKYHNPQNMQWETIHEWHDDSNEGLQGSSFSPPVAIFNQGGKLLLKNGKGTVTYWTGPTIETDKLYELVYRVKFDKTAGEIEAFYGGQKVATFKGLTSNTGKLYLKIGNYRHQPTQGTSAILHKKLAIATTLASAVAA